MMLSYFDGLIEARRAGQISDHVHLGLFRDGSAGQALASAQVAMAQHHIDKLALTAGARVVDVGCGFGGTLRMIDGQVQALRLTGVNVDPRQIALARTGAWRGAVDWQLCDAAQFSQGRQGWADAILSLEAMFHFPDPAGFFAAAAQALRPGGRLVVSSILLARHAPAASIAAICAGFGPWPHPEQTLGGMCDMATVAGLEVIAVEQLAPWCLRGFDWMCAPCPADVTDNPLTELRRLFEAGLASYPVLVLAPKSSARGTP